MAGKGKAMNPLYRIALIAATLTFLTCGAYGQAGSVSVSVQSANNSVSARARFAAPHQGPAVTGAPYAAEEVSDHTQTLADGTHITQKTQVTKVFRDSEGRTRKERPIFRGMNGTLDDLMIVEIADPVSGFAYILDPYNHIAHRFAPPEGAKGPARYVEETRAVPQGTKPTPALHAANPPPSQTDRVEVSRESLGSQAIEGVNAEGTRTTRTIPVGMMGNDRPLVNVMESWFSPELGITVLTKNSDPRMGESVMQLRNIDRSEPDPALFRVPPDYQLVDDNGDAEIKIARP